MRRPMKHHRGVWGRAVWCVVAMIGATGVVFAQEKTPGQPAPDPKQSEPVTTPPPKPEPTLDELLGIPPRPGDADKPAAQPAPDPKKAELDRQLTTEESPEEFEQVVRLMGDVSQRLGDSRDAGLDTQRLQNEILLKLDKIIDAAQKNQNSSKSKSKGSKQKQDQQDAQQQQQQSSQAQQQGQQQGQQAQGGNVPQQPADGRPAAAGASAAWGNLPEHVRDALRQGLGDHFSSVYKSLTEQYYKRLAEEPKASGGVR